MGEWQFFGEVLTVKRNSNELRDASDADSISRNCSARHSNFQRLLRHFILQASVFLNAIAKRQGPFNVETEEHLREAGALVATLEPGELSLLTLLVDGHSLIQIAGRLGVGLEDAVKLKISTMKKLNAATTAELVSVGLQAGFESKEDPWTNVAGNGFSGPA